MTGQDVVDRTFGNREMSRNILRLHSACGHGAYLPYLCFRKLGTSVLFALRCATIWVAEITAVGNVMPTDATNDTANSFTLHSVFLTESLLSNATRFVSGADFNNLRLGKFSDLGFTSTAHQFRMFAKAMLITGRRIKTALDFAILRVVFHRPCKEMVGIATRGIVASMTDKIRSGVDAMGKKIGNAMGSVSPSLRDKSSVAIGIAGSLPRPTVVGVPCSNARPKTTYITGTKNGEKLWSSHNRIIPCCDISRNIVKIPREYKL